MDIDTGLTVGAVAGLARVTVRTLHHYDEIGLVSPGDRTDAGYRLYGRPEVERLQEVLFFRELGFGLDEIKRIVDDPGYHRTQALLRQRELLEAKADRLLTMVDAIEKAIEAGRSGVEMTHEELLEVFGGFDPAEHKEEADERWGGSDELAESVKRVNRYTKADWEKLQAEAAEINDSLLHLMDIGVEPDSEEAMDLAERHRSHICKWFYDCTPEIHAGLGEMYVSDARFAENIDKAGEGLAEFLSAAIAANSRRG